jgi:hypothetical protein
VTPIDQGYRRYGGGRAPRGRAWAVIAASGIRTFFGKRALLGLLLLSWGQFFVRTVQIYLAANLPQATVLAPTPETFWQFFDFQQLFVFVVTVYVGAGLVANDRRARLQICCQAAHRADYVFGKLAILMAFLLLITWVPANHAPHGQVLLPNGAFVRSHAYFPAITLVSSSARFPDHAGPFVTFDQQPLRGRPLRHGYLLHSGALQRAQVRDRRVDDVLDGVYRQSRAGRQRHLPPSAAIRHFAASVSSDDRRARRRLSARSRAAGSRRGLSRDNLRDCDCRPSLEVADRSSASTTSR